MNITLQIEIAAENNNSKVVKILLNDPRVSPEADDNAAVKSALENGHSKVVKLLLSDPRVSLDYLSKY